jgi:hypothetical protein
VSTSISPAVATRPRPSARGGRGARGHRGAERVEPARDAPGLQLCRRARRAKGCAHLGGLGRRRQGVGRAVRTMEEGRGRHVQRLDPESGRETGPGLLERGPGHRFRRTCPGVLGGEARLGVFDRGAPVRRRRGALGRDATADAPSSRSTPTPGTGSHTTPVPPFFPEPRCSPTWARSTRTGEACSSTRTTPWTVTADGFPDAGGLVRRRIPTPTSAADRRWRPRDRDQTVECSGSLAAVVHLDGTGSTDPDATSLPTCGSDAGAKLAERRHGRRAPGHGDAHRHTPGHDKTPQDGREATPPRSRSRTRRPPGRHHLPRERCLLRSCAAADRARRRRCRRLRSRPHADRHAGVELRLPRRSHTASLQVEDVAGLLLRSSVAFTIDNRRTACRVPAWRPVAGSTPAPPSRDRDRRRRRRRAAGGIVREQLFLGRLSRL